MADLRHVPPMPETFRYRAPAMVPVWFSHEGGFWGLINRAAIAEVIADCCAEYPDLPAPEVVDDGLVEDPRTAPRKG